MAKSRLQFRHREGIFSTRDEALKFLNNLVDSSRSDSMDESLYGEPIVVKYKDNVIVDEEGNETYEQRIILAIGVEGHKGEGALDVKYHYIDSANIEKNVDELSEKIGGFDELIKNIITAVGLNEDASYSPVDKGEYISKAKSVKAATRLLDAAIKAIQDELDNTQKGAGLNDDGSYEHVHNHVDDPYEYISKDGVDSLYEADKALDKGIQELKADSIRNVTVNHGKEDFHVEEVIGEIKERVAYLDITTTNLNLPSRYESEYQEKITEHHKLHNNMQLSEALAQLEANFHIATGHTSGIHIQKVEDNLPANVREAYDLVDAEGNKAEDSDTIYIYKDSSFVDAKLGHVGAVVNRETGEITDGDETNHEALILKYIDVEGGYVIAVIDLGLFLLESEFKDGLIVNGNGEVRVKIDESSEVYLTVGPDGVKLDGIDNAIESAVNVEKTRAEDVESKLGSKINTVIASVGLNEDGTYEKHTSDDGFKYINNRSSIDEETQALDRGLQEEERRATLAENALQVEIDNIEDGVGLNGNGEYIPNDNTNFISAATSVINATELIDEELKNIHDKVDRIADERELIYDGIVKSAGLAYDAAGGVIYNQHPRAEFIGDATSIDDATVKLNDALQSTNTNLSELSGSVISNAVSTKDNSILVEKSDTGTKISVNVDGKSIVKDIATGALATDLKVKKTVEVDNREVHATYTVVDNADNQKGEAIEIPNSVKEIKSAYIADVDGAQTFIITSKLDNNQEETVSSDASKIVAESDLKNGFMIVHETGVTQDGRTVEKGFVHVRKSEDSEDYFFVKENGVGVNGITQAINDAKAAAKTEVKKGEGTNHVTVTSETNEDDHITYFINDSDIASESALNSEIERATSKENEIAQNVSDLEKTVSENKKSLTVKSSGNTINVTKDENGTNVDVNIDNATIKASADGKIGTTLTLSSVTPSDGAVREEYTLVDGDGLDRSEKVHIKIYKDSSFVHAQLGHSGATVNEDNGIITDGSGQDVLIMEYLNDKGKYQIVEIPLGDFLRQSEFKNGLQVSEKGEVSIKLSADNEFGFLNVDETGLKLSGVQFAIDTAKAAATTVVKENNLTHISIAETTESDGHKVYTVSETNIASDSDLTTEIERAKGEEARIDAELADIKKDIKKTTVTSSDDTINVSETTDGTDVTVNIDNTTLVKSANGIISNGIKVKELESTEIVDSNIWRSFKLADSNGNYLPNSVEIQIPKTRTIKKIDVIEKESVQYLRCEYEVLGESTTYSVDFDINELLAENDIADGLTVDNHKVKVKVDPESESFVSVTESGIRIKGISDAINVAKTVVKKGSESDHVTVDSEVATDGHVIYTINDKDIASATALTEEINTRTSEISDVKEKILEESTRAKDAERELAASVTEETTRAQLAEAALESKITTEISKESAAREAADKVLEASIAQEANIRETNDKLLQNSIDNEASARDNADKELERKLNEETARANEADANLQKEIDKVKESVGLEPDGSVKWDSHTGHFNGDATIKDAVESIDEALTNLEGYVNGDGGINDKFDNLQEELDRTQSGAGLQEDGTYKPHNSSPDDLANYIDKAKSLDDADKILDEELKKTNDSLSDLDDFVKGEGGITDQLNDLEETVNGEINGLQEELDRTQKGSGLQEDGTYKPHNSSPDDLANYIDKAKSLDEADKILDEELKKTNDALSNLDDFVKGEGGINDQLNDLEDSVNGQFDEIQKELDRTQKGSGLNEDGSYKPHNSYPDDVANYIDKAESLNEADKILDEELKKTNDTLDRVKKGAGLNENGEYEPNTGNTYTSGATSLSDAVDSLDKALEKEVGSINDRLEKLEKANNEIKNTIFEALAEMFRGTEKEIKLTIDKENKKVTIGFADDAIFGNFIN